MAQSKVHLFRFSGVLLLALILVTALTLLFQHQNQLKQLVKMVQPDFISVAYLRLMIQMQPQDAALRLNLAQQLSDLGRTGEARAVLQPILYDNDKSNWPVRMMHLDIQRMELYAVETHDPQRKIKLRELADQVEAVASEEIPYPYLDRIAKLSLEFDRPKIAADIYDRLADIDSQNRPQWLTLAGQWHLATARPKRAGQAYQEAFTLSNDADKAQQFALLSLDALHAGNDQKAALAFVTEHLDRFPRNRQLLERAVAIARTQSMFDQALRWGEQLLALDPNNEELLERQLNLALEASELSTALTIARQLVQLQPDNRTQRHRLALIAEWTGDPRYALDQWLWLAHNDLNSPKSARTEGLKRALSLARGLSDDRSRIEILDLISAQRALDDAEMKELSDAFYRSGKLKAGIKFFRTNTKRYPKRYAAWKALAELQEQSGNLKAAAETWHHIGVSFDRPFEAAFHKADLLWQLGQKEKAFDHLSALWPDVGADQIDFWNLLGEQAWSLDRSMQALTVYRTLWNTGNADALATERLILLARNADLSREVITVAEEGYKRHRKPRFLLLGMDEAIATKAWGDLARLTRIARNEPQQFQNVEMYWLQEALLSVHEERYTDADRQYHKALQLNPASTSARMGLLWLLIQTNDVQRLPHYLQRWQADALTESAYWGAYAAALSKLGWAQEALPWYQRQANAKPQDSNLQLNYTHALAQAGQTDAAWKRRRGELNQLRSAAQLNIQ